VARAKASDDQVLIAHQQLRIEKLTRELYGPRSERTSRILDQIELQFEELESSATEDESAAEMAVAKTTTVAAFSGLFLARCSHFSSSALKLRPRPFAQAP
jgi:transposase